MAKVIIGDRLTGRTTELVRDSARLNAPILCIKKSDIWKIKDIADQLQLEIPDPIIYVDKQSLRGRELPNGVIIDDIDQFLRSVIGINVDIKEISLNLNVLTDIKLLTKNKLQVNNVDEMQKNEKDI